MIPIRSRLFALAVCFALAPVARPATCDGLKAQIQRTYGFRPSELDAAAQDKKSEQMDAVWSAVRSHSAALTPCLKQALSTTDDAWFLFDGAQLLVSLEDSREAKELLLRGLQRVSLDDVALGVWIADAARLGLDGLDTAELGRRWLLYPHAHYALPAHAYEVDRQTGALFLFGALDERFATPALVKLSQELTGDPKEIAVQLLRSQATPEALQALGDPPSAPLIEPRSEPKTSRQEFVTAFNALLRGDEKPFNDLIEAVPDGERDLVAVFTKDDLELLRKVRRYYAAKANPHAIEYYDQFTQIILTVLGKTRPS